MTRAEQAQWATKLQTVLNGGEYNGEYSIRFDMGDSNMTYCYHNGNLYKVVPNEAMRGSINVYDYTIQNN